MSNLLRGAELRPWQLEAVDAWVTGRGRPFHGTLEIVTGGGKTLIALACVERALQVAPDLRVAIVVPSIALAEQWHAVLGRFTSIDAAQIGILGGGRGAASFGAHRVIIAVLNSAAKKLPALARDHQPLMLIIDECHRAGAPSFSAVLSTPADFRLGLSATPDREEVDGDGEPLRYDEQLVGQSLGDVVYRFTLQDARLAGWLPDFQLHHHGVTLTPDERQRYDLVSRRVDESMDVLRQLGHSPDRARSLAGRKDEVGQAASVFVALTAERKDLLYRAGQRERVVIDVLTDLVVSRPGLPPRVILFHERVDEAVHLHASLQAAFPHLRVELEHSALPAARRRAALEAFRSGDAPILVSVKSLIEGIDVPEADVGVSVASSASVRQRIQALGRVLRKPADGRPKTAYMHIVYASDTVDDLIYAKADWTDLTGAENNHYWRWPLDGPPEAEAGPPRVPKPTEDQAWALLGRSIVVPPVPWPGVVTGQEYSVSTKGTVHNAFRRLIRNPQGIGRMVESVRGKRGGRFIVTPGHRLVLVWGVTGTESSPFLAGQLLEPFEVVPEIHHDVDVSELAPGDEFLGASNSDGGTFKISAKGEIERRTTDRGREWAHSVEPSQDARVQAAADLIHSWRQLGQPTYRIHVNHRGNVWYEEEGVRRYLGTAPDGFLWPTDMDGST